MSEPWLIRKSGVFYRPKRAGYTSNPLEAGHYSKEEAEAEARIEDRISAHPLSEFLEGEQAIIDYTNWRGERSERTITPISLKFGSNEWHTEPQWFVLAYDIEKTAVRWFAMKDIQSWRPAPPKAIAGQDREL